MQLIFFLIGNRDLQVRSDYLKYEITNKAATIVNKYFIANSEGDDFVINKSTEVNFTFLEASEIAFLSYKDLKEIILFPMIEATLNSLDDRNPHLVFCGSKQQPQIHKQDSYYFAIMAEKYYKEKGFTTEINLFDCNPNDFESLINHFAQIFEDLTFHYERLVISNSGGTPNMRAVSHFAGIFKGFKYFTVNAFTNEVTQQTFKKQEHHILKQIAENMLAVYDYEGILHLPVANDIKHICRDAINLYNLNIDELDKQKLYGDKAANAIELIYNNLYVSYKQGRYADVLGRIHRLEEAVGQYLFYIELKSNELINEYDKVKRIDSNGTIKYDKKFELFDSQAQHKTNTLISFYPDLFIRKNNCDDKNWYFKNDPTVSINSGKHFYYFFFKNLDKNQLIYGFFEKVNNNYCNPNPLTSLRNKSILGHGFKGVALKDIEDVTGSFDSFLLRLSEVVEKVLNRKIQLIFDELNNKISSIL